MKFVKKKLENIFALPLALELLLNLNTIRILCPHLPRICEIEAMMTLELMVAVVVK